MKELPTPPVDRPMPPHQDFSPKHRLWFVALTLTLLASFMLDIMLGSVHIPLQEVIQIIFGGEASVQAWQLIVEKIRIPKAITALLAGSALSVSGLQMQTLFRNPLAGPSELGITAGAGLGVAVVMLGGGSAGVYAIRELGLSGSWLVIAMASAGSALVMLLILAIAGRIRDHVVLLIVGLMIGAITLSVVSIWQYYSNPEQLQSYILWTFGSLGGVYGSQLYVLGTIVIVGLLQAFSSSKALNILLLGNNYARTMGLTVGRSRLIILSGTSILTGSITAFCGPIGFIGIAVPHLTRALLGSSDHRILIPACCLVASILMLVCDILSQLPGHAAVLPINIVTSLLGAPVVIWVIVRHQKIRSTP
ncbi:iron complex transport system permease protein [Dyadobacter jejuensis]|uniref:Iron complex transport system permease protein n=1 Tax=Dyadobacter jejuensis TaxID=1082580 RepID=A0A316BAV8_9BACT|nr:iron ABC transporter permease [Dyadobacter jejuensis]PWJ59677.1 iron complex transport system permease protein [Dyadobacter jejuensis]